MGIRRNINNGISLCNNLINKPCSMAELKRASCIRCGYRSGIITFGSARKERYNGWPALDKSTNKVQRKVKVKVLDSENLDEKDKMIYQKYRQSLVQAKALIDQLEESGIGHVSEIADYGMALVDWFALRALPN